MLIDPMLVQSSDDRLNERDLQQPPEADEHGSAIRSLYENQIHKHEKTQHICQLRTEHSRT